MGNGFLLVFPVYYGDGFDGRCGGFLVTTLGFSGCSGFFVFLKYEL